MSKVRVLLLGVKTTLNRLAVKEELSWQVFRDLDSINRVAETLEKRERSVVRMTKGEDNIEDIIVRVCWRARRQGEKEVEVDRFPGMDRDSFVSGSVRTTALSP